MGKVKLPSGKIAKVPDGLTEQEVVELLFEKLPEGDDKKAMGDKLDTSGWGATIGGAVGGIGGAALGAFAGGVGALPGGAAGGALGAAAGEGIEQWISGKGDLSDVGTSALIGGAGGAIGGGALGAATKFGAKGAALYGGGVGAAEGAREGGTAGALTGAALGAATGGLGGGLVGKGVSKVSKHLGLDRKVDDALTGLKKPAEDYLDGLIKMQTGRTAAGGLKKAQAGWDIKRNLVGFLATQMKKKLGKSKLSEAEHNAINQRASQLLKDKASYKQFRDTAAETAKPKGTPVKRYGQEYLRSEDGGLYDYDGVFKGMDPNFAEGGQVRRSDPKGNYASRVADSGALSTAADFIPIIGDAKAAYEVYDEIQKPNPNWMLVGALGGAAIIGLIPGIGDAAAAAIKAGAKKGLGAVKKAPADEFAPVFDHTKGTADVMSSPQSLNQGLLDGNSGWNYSGKPEAEFQKDLDKVYEDMGLLSGKTDVERDLHYESPGLLDEVADEYGIATAADVQVADRIANALKSTGRNEPDDMVIKSMVDEAISSNKELSLAGLVEVLSKKTGMDKKALTALISN